MNINRLKEKWQKGQNTPPKKGQQRERTLLRDRPKNKGRKCPFCPFFEFKMCKKVAELTSVINSLFMKSTEADSKNKLAIHDLENEIKNLVNDFKNRENEIIEKYTVKI